MANDARIAYRNKLEMSKANADLQVRQPISAIGQEISAAVMTLKVSGQPVKLNVEEVVVDLEAVRDEWLNHLKSTFDSAFLTLKQQLST
jgi:hypothetical protein